MNETHNITFSDDRMFNSLHSTNNYALISVHGCNYYVFIVAKMRWARIVDSAQIYYAARVFVTNWLPCYCIDIYLAG